MNGYRRVRRTGLDYWLYPHAARAVRWSIRWAVGFVAVGYWLGHLVCFIAH